MKHFNNLTPTEAELLSITSEECGEIIQAIGKIQRHGLGSMYKGTSNRKQLSEELGDIELCIRQLIRVGIVDRAQINASKRAKIKRGRERPELLHHAKPL